MGRCATAEEVFKEVEADAIFYQGSGGGVTLSGGEPLAQPRFTVDLLKLCKDAGIHTAIETCGHSGWDNVRQILTHVDLVLYDFKHMDPLEHEKCTGVSNHLILDNAKKIHNHLSIPICARIPVIPGFNDSFANISATAKFIKTELGESIKVHLLPFHRLGQAKYERLEKPENRVSIDPPGEDRISELQKIVQSYGLAAIIGG